LFRLTVIPQAWEWDNCHHYRQRHGAAT